jgi:hypothetical protein
MEKLLRTVNAPCGAGKTSAQCEHIANLFRGRGGRFLYIVPTIDLSDQIKSTLKRFGVHPNTIHNIHSDKTCPSVSNKIIQVAEDLNRERFGVLIIQLEALKILPYCPIKGDWEVIIDEVPQIDTYHRLEVPYYHNIVREFIELGDQVNGDLYKVRLKSVKLATECIHRVRDTVNNTHRALIQQMLNGEHCYTLKDNWDRMDRKEICREKSEHGNDKNTLHFLSMLPPDRFLLSENTTLMGSNINYSICKKYWEEFCNIRFQENQDITKHLQFRHHENGHLVDIKWMLQEHYSKYYRDMVMPGSDDLTIGKDCDRRAIEYFKNLIRGDWLYVLNNDEKEQLPHGTRIKPGLFGLNCYSQYHNLYYGASLNRPPVHAKMLQLLGFNKEFISRATVCESAYQAALRLSIRNPKINERVHLVITSKETAQSVHKLLPYSTVGPLDDQSNNRIKKVPKTRTEIIQTYRTKSFIEKKVPKTPAERVREHRARKKQRKT